LIERIIARTTNTHTVLIAIYFAINWSFHFI